MRRRNRYRRQTYMPDEARLDWWDGDYEWVRWRRLWRYLRALDSRVRSQVLAAAGTLLAPRHAPQAAELAQWLWGRSRRVAGWSPSYVILRRDWRYALRAEMDARARSWYGSGWKRVRRPLVEEDAY